MRTTKDMLIKREELLEKQYLLHRNISDRELISENIKEKMESGILPDFSSICRELYDSFYQDNASLNALQFASILGNFQLSEEEIAKVIAEPETNHILIENALLKVVLIKWPAGRRSSVHGHAKGGCMFKVLNGKLVEDRFSADGREILLATCYYHQGGMAYIDDKMALHAVGNPFEQTAVSIHAYTPGL